MKTYDLSISYNEESENGVYIFLIYFTDELYFRIEINDIVTFNAGEKKITAKIYNIYYLGQYNKYYCKEMEEK